MKTMLDLILDHCGNPELPQGYDTWGWKITRPDLRTYEGFRWPWPGGTVTDPDAIANDDPCPTWKTGGYCVALSWHGARSGGHGNTTAVLLAYRQSDILARDDRYGKLRVREARVHDVIDVHRLIQRAGAGADLTGADLTGADLTDAYLAGANLAGANLARADLTGANLEGASLAFAYLTGADLAGADLTGADLTGANLTGADLTGADLAGALNKDKVTGRKL